MNRLQIHLRAHHCNLWPCLEIRLNGETVHSGEIQDDLRLDLPLGRNANHLYLEHYGKRFGQNRVWDTMSRDGVIINDRKIEIIDINIDGIGFLDKLQKLEFNQRPVDNEPAAPRHWDGSFNFNGSVEVDISPTPLNWLINFKLKQEHSPGISQFSDHTKLFHYEDDLALISEIEKILEGMP